VVSFSVSGQLQLTTERETDHSQPDGVGVGPHPSPWPDDPRLDPSLLREGDRRNVVDRYRYWTVEAIVADLDTHRHEFAVAIENWRHDMNIGTVVRSANAFLAREVVIVGRRRWNRRGAMVTDRYQHIRHVADVAELSGYAGEAGYTVVAIDNLPGAVPLETAVLPRRALLLFGQEGTGLTEAARAASSMVCSIAQYGSTRSINAGVAAGIAMHTWIRQHASVPPDSRPPDSRPPDSRPPDSRPPDSRPPDSRPPDSRAPDSRPPDSRRPAPEPACPPDPASRPPLPPADHQA
jgi:tRNA(Leu) C34 or U34 (ribose-2'-O)-methylase TrmL